MTEDEIRADRQRIVRTVRVPRDPERWARRQEGIWLQVNIDHPDFCSVVTVPKAMALMDWTGRRIRQLEEINSRLARENGLMRGELGDRWTG